MKAKQIILIVLIVVLLVGATVAIWLLASSNVRREQSDNSSQDQKTHKSVADTAADKGDVKTALKEYKLALDACPAGDNKCQAEMKQRIHEMESAMKVKLDPKTNLPAKKWTKPPAPALPKNSQKSQE